MTQHFCHAFSLFVVNTNFVEYGEDSWHGYHSGSTCALLSVLLNLTTTQILPFFLRMAKPALRRTDGENRAVETFGIFTKFDYPFHVISTLTSASSAGPLDVAFGCGIDTDFVIFLRIAQTEWRRSDCEDQTTKAELLKPLGCSQSSIISFIVICVISSTWVIGYCFGC